MLAVRRLPKPVSRFNSFNLFNLFKPFGCASASLRLSAPLRVLCFKCFRLPNSLHSCPKSGPAYNPPMLDIKLIRERPDFVRQRLATRGAGDEARIDELLKLDEQRRKLVAEVEALKAQRNRASKEIGALMG